ncbi:class I SAM-dependent methyltransferase [Nocardioides koreensis]|uniref:Class I SAM-dependent methyltransferase n=1 Tax=Nocardioides koreensis TaxID=433651 RepID=A0ABP5LZ21_9ACTN
MTPIDMSRALVFGRTAETYSRSRPTYPAEAVAWLVPGAAGRVADVGAGTGQLTGSLLERGLAVDAVEPDPAMLDVLRRLHPGATAHCAPSHRLPVVDHSLDAVLVADAWHWFPFDETVAEVRRVLRPGGSLGLVWNKVTPRRRWELELAGIDPDLKGTGDDRPVDLPFPADEAQIASFPHVWRVTPQQYRDCLSTNSAVILMTDEERSHRLDSAEALLADVCRREGTATVDLQQEAFCIRWTPGSPGS